MSDAELSYPELTREKLDVTTACNHNQIGVRNPDVSVSPAVANDILVVWHAGDIAVMTASSCDVN